MHCQDNEQLIILVTTTTTDPIRIWWLRFVTPNFFYPPLSFILVKGTLETDPSQIRKVVMYRYQIYPSLPFSHSVSLSQIHDVEANPEIPGESANKCKYCKHQSNTSYTWHQSTSATTSIMILCILQCDQDWLRQDVLMYLVGFWFLTDVWEMHLHTVTMECSK